MPVEIAGFAQALARCQVFEFVDPLELENALAAGREPLDTKFVDPSADVPLIRSGDRFTHLYFLQHGTIATWQYPRSELLSPYLIGDHEFMMNAERWVASYSAVTRATLVGVPVATMALVARQIPKIQDQMSVLVLRRMARYYWISLATNGSPSSRVAAALVSRLALTGEDHGQVREINVRQGDIVRLTVMSRSAVAAGISTLTSAGVISIGDDDSERFTGSVRVPDVGNLKEHALGEVRLKQVRPLVRRYRDSMQHAHDRAF